MGVGKAMQEQNQWPLANADVAHPQSAWLQLSIGKVLGKRSHISHCRLRFTKACSAVPQARDGLELAESILYSSVRYM